jgi:hypothetical protein
MKSVTDTTEYKALSIIARIVKDFEKLHFLVVIEKDSASISYSRDLLESIIHTNGYKINYGRNKKPLLKIKS